MYSRRSVAMLSVAGAGALCLRPRALFAQAGANINLSPRRIVFEANSRSSTVLVFNTGGEAATYNVSLVERLMLRNGAVVGVEDAPRTVSAADAQAVAAAAPGLKTAREMITYTPRRVVLGPGETQTIRLRVQRPVDLPPGEYRTHLTVTAVPPPDDGLTADQAAAQSTGGMSVRLTPLFSISIPLIVRQGPADVAGELRNVRYLPPTPNGDAPGGVLAFDLVRRGQSSLYGDLEIRGAGSRAPLGALGGVAVYPELESRAVAIPLSRAPSKGERLEITFRDGDTRVGQVLMSTAYEVA